MKIYFDFNDWWVGYYRGENYHFICPLPTLVIRRERDTSKWEHDFINNICSKCDISHSNWIGDLCSVKDKR
jgi:hypothetical protein